MDFLTCGSCQKEFVLSDIMIFMKHKKLDCEDSSPGSSIDSFYRRLMCKIKDCQEKFATAVGLLQHIQNQHALNVFITLSLYGSSALKQIETQESTRVEVQPINVNSSEQRVTEVQLNLSDHRAVKVKDLEVDRNMDEIRVISDISDNVTVVKDRQIEENSMRDAETIVREANKTPDGNNVHVTNSTGVNTESSCHGDENNDDCADCCGSTRNTLQKCEVDALATMSIGESLDDIHSRAPCLDPEMTCGVNCCVPKKPSNTIETQTDFDIDVNIEENGCHGDKCTPEKCAEKSCCDSQNCCITLIPGTHEKMKKCCSAVVPKKRKQHMESKHMPKGFWSRSKSTLRRRISSGYLNKSRPTNRDIFIDVGSPSSDQNNSENVFPTLPQNAVVVKDSGTRSIDSLPVTVSGNGRTNRGMVYLEPGSTLTIPVSYPSPEYQPQPLQSPLETLASLAVPSFVDQSNELSAVDQHNQFSRTAANSVPTTQQLQSNLTSSGQEKIAYSNHSSGFISHRTNSLPTLNVSAGSASSMSSSTDHLIMTIDNGGKRTRQSSTDSSKLAKKRRYPTSRPFKCDQCNESFNQRIHLKKHQSKHTGIKPFKCGHCDYSTVERSHLKVHIRIHTGEKPYKCTICGYATAQNSTLKIHLKRHHNGTTGFTCDTCGEQFDEETMLETHKQKHKE